MHYLKTDKEAEMHGCLGIVGFHAKVKHQKEKKHVLPDNFDFDHPKDYEDEIKIEVQKTANKFHIVYYVDAKNNELRQIGLAY